MYKKKREVQLVEGVKLIRGYRIKGIDLIGGNVTSLLASSSGVVGFAALQRAALRRQNPASVGSFSLACDC